MLKYLGAIEERSSEILQMYELCRGKPLPKPVPSSTENQENIKNELKESIFFNSNFQK